MEPLTPELLRRILLLLEHMAVGERLDAAGLNHDDNDLMTLVRRIKPVPENEHVRHHIGNIGLEAMCIWAELYPPHKRGEHVAN